MPAIMYVSLLHTFKSSVCHRTPSSAHPSFTSIENGSQWLYGKTAPSCTFEISSSSSSFVKRWRDTIVSEKQDFTTSITALIWVATSDTTEVKAKHNIHVYDYVGNYIFFKKKMKQCFEACDWILGSILEKSQWLKSSCGWYKVVAVEDFRVLHIHGVSGIDM